MQRLVLFDIDGTMLDSGGTAALAFREALREVFGTAGPERGYSFAGKTDPQIAWDLLRHAGFDEEEIASRLEQAWAVYLERLRESALPRRVRVYPGVVPLLDRISMLGNGAVLGLLTGNLAEGARLKLEAAGIGFDRFAVGAFGSDHRERAELPAIAIDRAERRFGHRFSGKDVVVIGDTPHDIACGAHLGVRTIAVATGSYSEEELAACDADHVFPSLADTERVWAAIFG